MRDARVGPWLIVLFTAGLPIYAQEHLRLDSRPASTATSTILATLGEQLFQDKRLSGNQSISCASCHRPDLSFTDGKRHAVGQKGDSLGKNTPTLYGVGSVAAFPMGGSIQVLAENVSLVQRVLAPLRNGAEMCESVEGAIAHLGDDKRLATRFDEAFGAASRASGVKETMEAGVTPYRLGAVLVAYLRSLTPPPSPGMLALQGAEASLSESQRKGLDLFRGNGRCTTCHEGSALTDGRSHVIATFRQQRRLSAEVPEIADVRPTSRPNATIVAGGSVTIDVHPTSDAPEARVFEVEFLPAAGIRSKYSHAIGDATFESVERQTVSLVDVGRTGPYFRDGSVRSLNEAVTRHVAELREAGADRTAIANNPNVLLAGVTFAVRNPPRVSLTDSARQQLSSDDWVPACLSREQVADLVQFLESLTSGR